MKQIRVRRRERESDCAASTILATAQRDGVRRAPPHCCFAAPDSLLCCSR